VQHAGVVNRTSQSWRRSERPGKTAGKGGARGDTMAFRCESGCNGKLRDDLLAREVFVTMLQAKVLIKRWRSVYARIHKETCRQDTWGRNLYACPPESAT
jgi:hypothetical protein